MNKPVGVIGCNGNMGKRYSAILTSLGIEWEGFDVGDTVDKNLNYYLIATPTGTHTKILGSLGHEDKRQYFMIEKPVCTLTSVTPQRELMPVRSAIDRGNFVCMVNQYAYYPGVMSASGDTFYDFYNSGNDGLGWDCIQIIHLAGGRIRLGNQSPVWHCSINGIELNRQELDRCYVRMITDFLSDRKNLWEWNDIRNAHEKTWKWQKDHDRGAGTK
jgi:hypothetical protein